jgi:hypothetical protein
VEQDPFVAAAELRGFIAAAGSHPVIVPTRAIRRQCAGNAEWQMADGK